MTDVETLLESYPGDFVAIRGDGSCQWSLCRVDLVKRTAFVVNGHYHIEWDDTDMYYRDRSNKLVWMFEIEPGFQIVRVREWLDQKNELKPGLPDGAESRGCSA